MDFTSNLFDNAAAVKAATEKAFADGYAQGLAEGESLGWQDGYDEGTRVIGESSRVLYTNTGGWSGAWKDEDGSEYEWVELLENEGSVKELEVPTETIKRLKLNMGGRIFRDEDVMELIQFVEAFA